MKTRRITATMLMAASIVVFAHICFYKEYGVYDYYLFSDMEYQLLICAAILFLSMLGTYFAHFAGYFICGKISGYELISVEVHGFVFRCKNGKFSIRKYKGRHGIFVNMSPPEFSDGKFPFALYNVGAVIAFSIVSLITFFFVLFYFLSDIPLPAFYWFCVFIWFFSHVVLYLLPVDRKSIGVLKRISTLKNSIELRRVYWQASMAYAGLLNGTRLREQPDELFSLPAEEYMSNSVAAEITWLRMNRLLDEGSFEEADRLIDFMISDKCAISDFKKKSAVLEKIYITLINKTVNSSEAEALLNDDIRLFMLQNRDFITVIRLEFALALLYYKDMKKASEFRERFARCLKNEPYPANIAAEIDLVELAERTAEEK